MFCTRNVRMYAIIWPGVCAWEILSSYLLYLWPGYSGSYASVKSGFVQAAGFFIAEGVLPFHAWHASMPNELNGCMAWFNLHRMLSIKKRCFEIMLMTHVTRICERPESAQWFGFDKHLCIEWKSRRQSISKPVSIVGHVYSKLRSII